MDRAHVTDHFIGVDQNISDQLHSISSGEEVEIAIMLGIKPLFGDLAQQK